MKRKCKDCIYFVEKFKGSKYGICHRFPPINGRFPSVKNTDWCGEFISKESEEKLQKLKQDANFIYELLKPLARIVEDD